MKVHLTPEQEALVQKQIKTGRYNSASEVVRDALRLLEERDQVRQGRVQEMRQRIREGWESLRRGEGCDGEVFLRELEAELDEMEKTNNTG